MKQNPASKTQNKTHLLDMSAVNKSQHGSNTFQNKSQWTRGKNVCGTGICGRGHKRRGVSGLVTRFARSWINGLYTLACCYVHFCKPLYILFWSIKKAYFSCLETPTSLKSPTFALQRPHIPKITLKYINRFIKCFTRPYFITPLLWVLRFALSFTALIHFFLYCAVTDPCKFQQQDRSHSILKLRNNKP